MAGSVNLVILVGNLGQDPEVTGGKQGKVIKLSIATSESWRDKNSGERKEVTDWHRVTVFDPTAAEFAEKYLKKGHKVYVEGKQKTRKWEKDGVTHYSTEVVLSGFGAKLLSLTSSGGRGAPSEEDYGTERVSESPAQKAQGQRLDDAIDEIPF